MKLLVCFVFGIVTLWTEANSLDDKEYAAILNNVRKELPTNRGQHETKSSSFSESNRNDRVKKGATDDVSFGDGSFGALDLTRNLAGLYEATTKSCYLLAALPKQVNGDELLRELKAVVTGAMEYNGRSVGYQVANNNKVEDLFIVPRKIQDKCRCNVPIYWMEKAPPNKVSGCEVQMRSYAGWGSCDNDQQSTWKYGFIQVNNIVTLKGSFGARSDWPNLRGVNTQVLDLDRCVTSGSKQFDTWGQSSQAGELVTYLNTLRKGTILLVVSFDESTQSLTSAYSTLLAAGADVRSVGYSGMYAFIMQKGYPEKTVLQTHVKRCDATGLTVSVTGSTEQDIKFKLISSY